MRQGVLDKKQVLQMAREEEHFRSRHVELEMSKMYR